MTTLSSLLETAPSWPRLQCLVVDDDPLALQIIAQCVERLPTLQLAGTSTSATDAVAFMQRQPVDILLLDVLMPEVSGLELLQILRHVPRPPHVILISSSASYAVQAFDHNVADYLVKPVSFERFQQAIGRVYSQRAAFRSPPEPATAVFIRVQNQLTRLNYADVFYLESRGNYVHIFARPQGHVLHTSLKALRERFPTNAFWVPHRSFLVNIQHIVEVSEDKLLMTNGKRLPISAVLRSRFLQRLQAL